MNYGSALAHSHVATFEDTVSKDAFLQLVYTFLRIRWTLQNPKIADYKKALDTFQQQHYHAFLYHCTERHTQCRRFIQLLQDFDAVAKKAKKHYVDLFQTLATFGPSDMPGGHFKGMPFVFTDRSAQKWYYDEVKATKKLYKVSGSDLVYPVHAADGQWTGHVDCPANRLRVPKTMTQAVAQYLVHVGYETPASAADKWNIACETVSPQPYALVHDNVGAVNDVLRELDAHHQETREDCLRLHLQSPTELRARVFKRIVQRYDDSIRQLSCERDKWRQECEQTKTDLVEHEMLLSSAKRKIDHLYKDIHHLDAKHKRARAEVEHLYEDIHQLDSQHKRARAEAEHLADTLRHKDAELRQSIDAQWQLYHQLQRR